MRVGVLALQGDVREHRAALRELDCDAVAIRTPDDLTGVEALVLPGGESTTISHLLRTSGLLDPLEARLRDGMHAFGTCAGLVLLARDIEDGRDDQVAFGTLDVRVRRNGYGRQVRSFESTCEVAGHGAVPTVFIRAPRIESVGDEVDVLAETDVGDGAHPVLVRQGPVMGASFHPELTADRTVHRLFLELAAKGTVSAHS